MYPHIRHSSDPFEGLKAQLMELIGLIKIVPPLIEADRERRWNEIGARPGDPDSDWIAIYETEAGPEEGWGRADFSHTIQAAAVVTAWGTFHECIIRQLLEECLAYDLKGHPALACLIADERRKLDRRLRMCSDDTPILQRSTSRHFHTGIPSPMPTSYETLWYTTLANTHNLT